MSEAARAMLLEAPEEARRYLAKEAEGVGLLYAGEFAHGDGYIWGLHRECDSLHPRRSREAWLPCDPTEILRVAARLAGEEWTWALVPSAAELVNEDGVGMGWQSGDPSTAALACFLEAWKKREPTKEG